MNVPVAEEEIVGVVELLNFITSWCNNQHELLSEALRRFVGVDYPACELRDDVIACADYLARTIGFADATMDGER